MPRSPAASLCLTNNARKQPDNCQLSRSKYQNRVERWHIEAFVEHIDGKNNFEFAISELLQGGCARRTNLASVHRHRFHPLVEFGQKLVKSVGAQTMDFAEAWTKSAGSAIRAGFTVSSFASPQGLWDLSCWGDFRRRPRISKLTPPKISWLTFFLTNLDQGTRRGRCNQIQLERCWGVSTPGRYVISEEAVMYRFSR